MISSERRILLKLAATFPLAVFLSPVLGAPKSSFDEFINRIAKKEKTFVKIGKQLQENVIQREYSQLKRQIMRESGCSECESIESIENLIFRRVKDDFRNDRVVDYQGWVLSKTELNICHLSALS
jgi:hypothetical protein